MPQKSGRAPGGRFEKKPEPPVDPNACNRQWGGAGVDFGYCHTHRKHFDPGQTCPDVGRPAAPVEAQG